MAKEFASRISKKERKLIDLTQTLGREVFKYSDEKLLKGAKLDDVRLKDIIVKEQVRTKFNDDSIKDLAQNIQENGLIQPLVIHLKDNNFTLICGERRYRAMSSIDMEKAPCFIIENKTQEELMAIQFSENSSREALHYIDKADGIYNYQMATNASERKIVTALGISKSEVHRSLILGKLSMEIKEAAKRFDIEKYVLLEFDAIEDTNLKKKLEKALLNGELTKRNQLANFLKNELKGVKGTKGDTKGTSSPQSAAVPTGLSANAFIKAIETQSKSMDVKTQKILKQLMEEAKEIVNN